MARHNVSKWDKMPGFSIEESLTIREKVFSVVRDHITSGRFSPGSRLIETRLAQELNISRTPVREALHMLEREGLLESIPRVGYRLRNITWEEIEDICEIRVINETLAAHWAIARIKPQDLQALESCQLRAESDAQKGDVRRFVDHDAEFHEIVARASGSTRLYELCDNMRRHMLLYRLESISHIDTVVDALAGHRRILDCIKNKDLEGVGTAVREHLDFAKSSIRRHAFDEKT